MIDIQRPIIYVVLSKNIVPILMVTVILVRVQAYGRIM